MVADETVDATDLACPNCRAPVVELICTHCGRTFPTVAGLPDLRIVSDRFLDLEGERAKAERLAAVAPGVDLKGLAEAYYAMTPDVEPRRRRSYLGHILGAEARGSALAELLPPEGRILEVGCGTGGLLAAAARRGLVIEGTDIALRWLVVAARRLQDRGLQVPMVAASADRLPYPDRSFDAVVADSVLEHLDDPAGAVREWARVLRPGGTLLAWSPNRYALTVDPHVRLWGLGWLPHTWMPAYVRWRRGGAWPPACLSTGEARRMASDAGFETIEVEAPAIPERWARSRPASERRQISVYNWIRRAKGLRPLLRTFGPLWQLRATRGSGMTGSGRSPWSVIRSGSLSLGERAGVRVPAGPVCPEGSRSGPHRRCEAPHPGPLPEGEGGRKPRVGSGAGSFLAPQSMCFLLASEVFASVVGFGVMIHLARRLGPSGFADFEYASAVAAWWLVLVRGGFDAIAYREAARRPSLVGPLTDLLIGLRLASAVFGFAVVLGLAWASGPGRGWVVAVAGLVLFPSAMASDVGFRASGRFSVLAMAQAARAIGLAIGTGCLVARPDQPAVAAGCVGGAEVFSTMVLLAFHGPTRPRFRRRAWLALSRRGAVAGATRFGRVSLYAVDVLAVGWWAGPSLGPYAAARRVALALLAVGLVVPSAVAPRIARAWASGRIEARAMIARTLAGLMAAALPATVGLIGTSDRWMPRLFGDEFRDGGPWLALVAAKLPFVLVSNVQQAALIACRREVWALRLILWMTILGVVLIPALAVMSGPRGVGSAVLTVEFLGVVGGWLALGKLGLAPSWHHSIGPAAAGCVGLAGTCWIGRGWPLGGVVIAGVGVYGLIWGVVSHSGAKYEAVQGGSPT